MEATYFKLKNGLSKAVMSANKRHLYHFKKGVPSVITNPLDQVKFRGQPNEYDECDQYGNIKRNNVTDLLSGKNAPAGAKTLSYKVYNKENRTEKEKIRKKEDEKVIINKITQNSLDSLPVTTIFSGNDDAPQTEVVAPEIELTEEESLNLESNNLDNMDISEVDTAEELETVSKESGETSSPKKRGRKATK